MLDLVFVERNNLNLLELEFHLVSSCVLLDLKENEEDGCHNLIHFRISDFCLLPVLFEFALRHPQPPGCLYLGLFVEFDIDIEDSFEELKSAQDNIHRGISL